MTSANLKHIHSSVCHSTQDIIKEQLSADSSINELLVSTEQQVNGHGRGIKKWIDMPGSVCFSFIVKPHVIPSYTALEISVIILNFFRETDLLKLKWPNDIINSSGLKCGGILIESNQSKMIAGIGLNLFSDNKEFGGIKSNPIPFNKKDLSIQLYQFITSNRYLSTELLKQDWIKYCSHLNKKVLITEDSQSYEGIFIGLGDYGQAIIQADDNQLQIFNGTLRSF